MGEWEVRVLSMRRLAGAVEGGMQGKEAGLWLCGLPPSLAWVSTVHRS
jgi:hypothetical protein